MILVILLVCTWGWATLCMIVFQDSPASCRHTMQRMRSLTFDRHFNQSLQNVNFPPNLRSLTFGHSFNQTLEGVSLPETLEHLIFGDNFRCLKSKLLARKFHMGGLRNTKKPRNLWIFQLEMFLCESLSCGVRKPQSCSLRRLNHVESLGLGEGLVVISTSDAARDARINKTFGHKQV